MHIGKNISKIRELLGVKQEALAITLKISQQTISKIEQTENLRDNTIERIANALGVTSSTILNYDERAILDFLKGELPTSEPHLERYSESILLLTKIAELYERLFLAENEKMRLLPSNQNTCNHINGS